MLGDPNLDPENQAEWIPLILKCLPCKTLPSHLNVPQSAKCLERVARSFEEFTIHSTLFQVSGSGESKRKHILRLRRHADNHPCICSAQLSVRLWTTAAEEIAVSADQGNGKTCAFQPESTLYSKLVTIPDTYIRSAITYTPHALQPSGSEGTTPESSTSSVDGTASDPTDNLAPVAAHVVSDTQPGVSEGHAQSTTVFSASVSIKEAERNDRSEEEHAKSS